MAPGQSFLRRDPSHGGLSFFSGLQLPARRALLGPCRAMSPMPLPPCSFLSQARGRLARAPLLLQPIPRLPCPLHTRSSPQLSSVVVASRRSCSDSISPAPAPSRRLLEFVSLRPACSSWTRAAAHVQLPCRILFQLARDARRPACSAHSHLLLTGDSFACRRACQTSFFPAQPRQIPNPGR